MGSVYMQVFALFAKGIAVGAANVMPGISGATLAVIFRVYDRLIEAINGLTRLRSVGESPEGNWKSALRFLFPFGLGMALGIVAVGSVISILIGMFSFQSAGFIAGLMTGSIPFLYTEATKQRKVSPNSPLNRYAAGKPQKSPMQKSPPGWFIHYAAGGLAALIIALLSVAVPTPELYMEGALGFGAMALLFIGGLLAAAAMVVPGVSGAMVLILLGIYPLAMDTINRIREYAAAPFSFELLPPILQIIIPIGLGVIPGILLASKGIALLLEKHFSLTYFIIIGLVLGTIFALFADPRTYQSGDVTPLSAGAAAAVFIAGALLALKLGKQKNTP
jgi:putative membrane protein